MRISLILMMIFVLPGTALSADLLITWQDAQGNQIKVAHRDDYQIRMDSQPDSFTLLQNDKVYVATKDEGEWRIIDLDQMPEMMKGFGAGSASFDPEDYQATYKTTGKTEKIASYKGAVYIVEVRDQSNKLLQKDEVVFSKHKDVRRASRAMLTIATRMGSKLGSGISAGMDKAIQQAEDNDYGGTLRFGKDMKIVNIEKKTLPADYFKLPVDPANINQPSSAQPEKKGGFFGQLMGDSEDAAKDETRASTVEEVREGVRGVFKNLFD